MSVKSIFEVNEFKQHKKTWSDRQNILGKRAGYYDGTVYEKARELLGWLAPRLYSGIKPLYLPLSRAVDVDAGIIPGGWLLPLDDPKSELWQQAINTIFDWSCWDTEGVLYVHYGAQYGVSGLRIVDERESGVVIIEPTDPLKFLLIGSSIYDTEPDMAIWIEKMDDGKEFEYAEVTTPELIRTFKNGTPFGFDGRDPEYKNELGFVPYVEVRHYETGKRYGEATFQKAMPLLDEVNQMASYLADIIAKNADVQWFLTGVEPSELEHGGSTAWFAPAGAEAKPLVPGIDIDGVLAFIKEIASNVKESLPELAFDDLRSKTQIATATLELQLMELVLKVKRTRPNYDRGLIAALKMAGKAGVSMSIPELGILVDDELRFDDKRNVLPQDEKAQIELDMMKLELDQMREALIMEGLGDDS